MMTVNIRHDIESLGNILPHSLTSIRTSYPLAKLLKENGNCEIIWHQKDGFYTKEHLEKSLITGLKCNRPILLKGFHIYR